MKENVVTCYAINLDLEHKFRMAPDQPWRTVLSIMLHKINTHRAMIVTYLEGDVVNSCILPYGTRVERLDPVSYAKLKIHKLNDGDLFKVDLSDYGFSKAVEVRYDSDHDEYLVTYLLPGTETALVHRFGPNAIVYVDSDHQLPSAVEID